MQIANSRLSREAQALRRHLVPEVRAADLARKAGVTRQYVSSVLAGQRPPSARLLHAATELGIPLEKDSS